MARPCTVQTVARHLQVKAPAMQYWVGRLQAAGLELPCWQGPAAPDSSRLWLLSHAELLEAWRQGQLGDRQLVIPETTLWFNLEVAAARYPHKAATFFCGQTISYAELRAVREHLAVGLAGGLQQRWLFIAPLLLLATANIALKFTAWTKPGSSGNAIHDANETATDAINDRR
mgnify:CR=1 FL=1